MSNRQDSHTMGTTVSHRTWHTPSEETDLDSGLNMPHVPMHVHLVEEPLLSSSGDKKGNGAEVSAQTHSLKGDRASIGLLILLYVLQGIPLGLAGSIPYLLQSRGISYKDQAKFSFAFWPFSIKLLWAPIVDAAYFARFGRRKTWLVPTQYVIGIFMLVLSSSVSRLIGDGTTHGDGMSSSPPEANILLLTTVFFAMNFLAATQDIAVDGWALTMLSRRNVGWASTCNSVGQTAGYFLGNVVFLALESADFCNSYLRSTPQPTGILTLSGFLYFWGVVFFVTTTMVMIFKHEKPSSTSSPGDEEDQGIVDTYRQLMRIVRLPTVLSLVAILLTSKIGFAATDALTGLKLIEAGVPKERLALLGIPMVPIQIILPLIISRYTGGPKPLSVFLKAMPLRLLMGVVFTAVVWWAPSTRNAAGEYPFYFYVVILVVYATHQMTLYPMFVSLMAFHARICDPSIGGSYMTLLNTFANLGGNWPSTVSLWLVDSVTWRTCSDPGFDCNISDGAQACSTSGGHCNVSIDGYYIETFICILVGFLWLRWRSRRLRQLETLPSSAWHCS